MKNLNYAICDFHYFTFSLNMGYTLPYVWVGSSGNNILRVCIFSFIVPGYMGSDDIDDMVSMIGSDRTGGALLKPS